MCAWRSDRQAPHRYIIINVTPHLAQSSILSRLLHKLCLIYLIPILNYTKLSVTSALNQYGSDASTKINWIVVDNIISKTLNTCAFLQRRTQAQD